MKVNYLVTRAYLSILDEQGPGSGFKEQICGRSSATFSRSSSLWPISRNWMTTMTTVIVTATNDANDNTTDDTKAHPGHLSVISQEAWCLHCCLLCNKISNVNVTFEEWQQTATITSNQIFFLSLDWDQCFPANIVLSMSLSHTWPHTLLRLDTSLTCRSKTRRDVISISIPFLLLSTTS